MWRCVCSCCNSNATILRFVVVGVWVGFLGTVAISSSHAIWFETTTHASKNNTCDVEHTRNIGPFDMTQTKLPLYFPSGTFCLCPPLMVPLEERPPHLPAASLPQSHYTQRRQ